MTRLTPTRHLALLLAILLAATGCPATQVGTSLSMRGALDGVSQTIPLISGRLLDPQGNPVSGATIRAYSAPYRVAGATPPTQPAVVATTDEDGGFVLTDPPKGSIAVEAREAGSRKALKTGIAIAQGTQLELGTLTLRPTGTIRGQVTIGDGTDLLGTEVFIPGTDYLAKTDASGRYTFTEVPEGSHALAAMRPRYRPRVIEGLQLAPGTELEAPVLALSLDAPVLKVLSPAHGGPGATIRLEGENFGATEHRVLQVSFDDTLAVSVRRVRDTVIEAVVPPGATSGQVVVRSDGIASEGLPFRVLASLELDPPYAGLYVGECQTFRVTATDTTGAQVPAPVVSWELGTPALGSLDSSGQFAAREDGWTEVRARSGATTGLAATGITSYTQTPLFPDSSLPDGSGSDLAIGPDGTIYTSDWRTCRIYRRDASGQPIVVAGTGVEATSPDGTLAAEASLARPVGLAVDAAGNLFFVESTAHRVRVIPAQDGTLCGQSVVAGRLHTLAGSGTAGYNGDGPDARAQHLKSPGDVLLEADGGLIVSDTGNNRIRRIAPDGSLVTLVGGGARLLPSAGVEAKSYGETINNGLARDAAGNVAFTDGARVLFYCREAGTHFGRPMHAGMVYTVAGHAQAGFNGDGPALARQLSAPTGMLFTPSGELLLCAISNLLLRKLCPDGTLRTIAGQRYPSSYPLYSRTDLLPEPGPATARRFGSSQIGLMPDGRLIIGETTSLRLFQLEPHE